MVAKVLCLDEDHDESDSEADDSGWEDVDNNEDYFSDLKTLSENEESPCLYIINTNHTQMCKHVLFIATIHEMLD